MGMADSVQRIVSEKLLGSSRREDGRDLDGDSLAPIIHEIFTDISDCLEFRKIINAGCQFIPQCGKPIFCEVLSKDKIHRLSVIGVHRLSRLPVHDHPGTRSIQLLLHGRLTVRRFHVLNALSSKGTVILQSGKEQVLGVGETSVIDEDSYNLHSLVTREHNAICLSLQLPPCNSNHQSWYFPLVSFEQIGLVSHWMKLPNRSKIKKRAQSCIESLDLMEVTL